MVVRILDDYYLAITALVTIVYQMFFFAIAATCKFDKVTDFAGSSNFVAIAILTLVLGENYHSQDVRQIVASACVILWGTRLGAFLVYRIIKTEKDRRFDGRRESPLDFLFFWIFQMMWSWAVSLPITFINSPRVSDPQLGGKKIDFGTPTDIVGVTLFGVGFIIEVIADYQKFSFRQKRSDENDFMKTGLWSWSRHPNYFGEIVVWWGIFILCLQPTISDIGTNAPYASVASPGFTMFLLLFVTGLPYNEVPTSHKQYESGNYASYQQYLDRTSILIPFPPFIWVRLPGFIKSILFDWGIYRYKPQPRDEESGGQTTNRTTTTERDPPSAVSNEERAS